jgi:hypothetical protein
MQSGHSSSVQKSISGMPLAIDTISEQSINKDTTDSMTIPDFLTEKQTAGEYAGVSRIPKIQI